MVDEPRCPGCGRAVAPGDRFCSGCGARLGEAHGAGEERKLVSVVFADLVGYTRLSGALDPEDTRRVLDAYWGGVREEVERHGGTVEKFIGDAVVGLFGAPAAHEDDAERAVRAALAIRERRAEPARPQVRIAVATGLALVRLAARPEAGEALVVGDVVTTAARLQEGAPPGGVLVDEPTRAATREAVRYRRVPAVAAKGRREPIPAWRAVGVRAPGSRRRAATRFVGRRDELSLLRTLLARARAGGGVGLVTVVGEPGIGKSRLVHELRTGDAERWEARVPPYGEGSAFSALAQLFVERAGADGVPALLAELVADEEERRRVERHVLRLVGAGRRGGGGAERGLESFAAWRRVIECAAARRPLVLVLEDVHWADDALLDFVEHLVEWAAPVPLLVLCTARPDLLRRRPGWGGGAQNALTLSLAPLSDAETARLVADVLGRAPDAGEWAALLPRAGGNPLYAEQLARMLAESGAAADSVPGTLQAVIAARIDRLPAREKQLLLDAAVVGLAFAPDALAALEPPGDPPIAAGLHELERLELVTRRGGDGVEWAFRHRLVCEVAYGAIARAARADKHRRVAEWLEARRLDDAPEQIAHHYLRAREEAAACGLPHAELAERARAALVRAAARALDLDAFAAAARLYAQALDLWPAGEPARPRHLLGYARALWSGEVSGEAVALEARDGLLAAGDVEGAAEAETLLSEMRWYRGDRAAAGRHLAHAVELVAGRPPSVAKALVLVRQARSQMLAGAWGDAIASGREALALAEALALPELQAEALNSIGSARFRAGDREGVADLERAIALAAGTRAAVVAYNNLGALLLELGDRSCSREALEHGCELAQRLGDRLHVEWFEAEALAQRFDEGRWDDLLADADAWLAGPHHATYPTIGVRSGRALVLHARGDGEAALEELARAERDARAAGDPQALVPMLGQAAFVLLGEGKAEEARRRAEDALALCERLHDVPPLAIFDLAVVARACDFGGRLRALLVAALAPSRWLEVGIHYLDGELELAVEALDATGSHWAAAYVRLAAAEAGGEGLEEALDYYRSVGAQRYVRRCEALAAAAATAR